jgi:hypothetical protein
MKEGHTGARGVRVPCTRREADLRWKKRPFTVIRVKTSHMG